MTREKVQEFTLRITRANSTQLVVVLYDMTISYLEDAKNAKEREEFAEALRKVRGCINELLLSLKPGSELSRNLGNLYLFFLRHLAAALRLFDAQMVAEIIPLFEKLRDAYKEATADNTEEPLMANAQDVYAGFTYGKTAQASEVSHQAPGRGMFV